MGAQITAQGKNAFFEGVIEPLSIQLGEAFTNAIFNEVSIKRILYRTGENEYYLNGSKCRLKDICFHCTR